jgi:hypothetical protein
MWRVAVWSASLLVTSALSGRAQAGEPVVDCNANFSETGSFLTGKKSTTWVQYSSTAKIDAFTRLYATLAKDGWNIASSDKDAGVISATQAVTFGKGSVAPLTVVVETDGAGSKVTMTFSVAGGQHANTDSVKSKMCSYLTAVEGKA